MRRRILASTWQKFRDTAKWALAQGLSPDDITFSHDVGEAALGQGELFQQPTKNLDATIVAATQPYLFPRRFVQACDVVAAHRYKDKWNLIYGLLWRQTHGEKNLLDDAADEAVGQFWRLHKVVQQDVHNCHAYVRFRPSQPLTPDRPHYVAWYEPDHLIVALAAPHFLERLGPIDWTLMTPDACAVCQDGKLCITEGLGRNRPNAKLTAEDGIEALWHIYYNSIFNPARLNMKATKGHMPKRFWKNMSETKLIPGMQAQADARIQTFVETQPDKAPEPESFVSLQHIAQALRSCTLCPWAGQSTQAVAGEGTQRRRLMLVGEQPGDAEDLAGVPFVGPAGRLLQQAMDFAGLSRQDAYVTNAVKHFKFEMRGKRRIHQKPLAKDVAQCHPYLVAEWLQVKPEVLVCLGTTAALAVFGKAVKLRDVRGTVHHTRACAKTWVTTHPSALLRMPDAAREQAMAQFVEDLRYARQLLQDC